MGKNKLWTGNKTLRLEINYGSKLPIAMTSLSKMRKRSKNFYFFGL
jgi:hypothetical protein